jgi:undecaprenyl-diphosphatase
MTDLFFIFAAKYLIVLPPLLLAVFFFTQPRDSQKKILIFAVPSLVLIYLTAFIAGHLYYDPRPFVVGNFTPLVPHAANNGFPSDHALFASAMAAIGMFLNRKLGIVLWVLAALVAAGRVYVGVHHARDVLASMLIALVVTTIIYFVIPRVWNKARV